MSGKSFGPQEKEAMIELIATGVRFQQAITRLGFRRATVLKALREDDEFRDEITEAAELVNESVEVAVLDMAKHGRDLEAAKYWLNNRAPDRWADTRRLEVTGSGGGPIQIAQEITGGLRELMQAEAEEPIDIAGMLLAASQKQLEPVVVSEVIDAEVIEDAEA